MPNWNLIKNLKDQQKNPQKNLQNLQNLQYNLQIYKKVLWELIKTAHIWTWNLDPQVQKLKNKSKYGINYRWSSKKLTDKKQIAIAREEYYWNYYRLKNQISDNCYLSKKRLYFEVTKVEKASSGPELKTENA